MPGGELQLKTTICDEIRDSGQPVIIDHVAEDENFCGHPTPAMYGFQSYISFPIYRPDGRFFGTLCAIDPRPACLKTPETDAAAGGVNSADEWRLHSKYSRCRAELRLNLFAHGAWKYGVNASLVTSDRSLGNEVCYLETVTLYRGNAHSSSVIERFPTIQAYPDVELRIRNPRLGWPVAQQLDVYGHGFLLSSSGEIVTQIAQQDSIEITRCGYVCLNVRALYVFRGLLRPGLDREQERNH